MHSLDRELRELGAPPASSIFSVRIELLIVLYVALAALVSGIGLLVRANLDRIGPAALTAALFAAAALCYALALRPRLRGTERSLWLDYVLLLGALLTSSAVGYAESQFHWLGEGWTHHLLILALWHAVTAYFFDSRLVLSVALTGFVAWLGIQLQPADLVDSRSPWSGLGWRAIGCSVLYAFGAFHHARGGHRPAFRTVYEQFAANLALAGSLALGFTEGWLIVGAVLLAGFAFGIARYGLWRRRESLVLWAVGYGTIGAIALEARVLDSALLLSNLGLLTVVGAVLLVLRLRAQLKKADA
ncbi:MAG: hypothetical protein ABW136_01910 [Steroidobacteraceae bacterium]